MSPSSGQCQVRSFRVGCGVNFLQRREGNARCKIQASVYPLLSSLSASAFSSFLSPSVNLGPFLLQCDTMIMIELQKQS